MKNTLRFFLILFTIGFTKARCQEYAASNEILFKIRSAELALVQEKEFNQGELSQIICLTNIGTKKGKGDYNGIVSFPSKTEIRLWKDWTEQNKSHISYSTNSQIYERVVLEGKQKVIQVEFEKGKFRNSVCDDDKYFQSWWLEWNSKK